MATSSPSGTTRPRTVVAWAALAGTLLVGLLMVVDVVQSPDDVLSLVQPGREDRTRPMIEEDFPDATIPDGDGLDGQITYALARHPFRVEETSDYLGRPRYRLQRPLLPWVAGVLHPGQGGPGLVWSLLAVGLVAVGAGAWAMGDLARRWGGSPWLGLAFPLLPGTLMSLRVTTSDAAGVALALLAVALAARHRTTAAVGVGVLAVLAKEPAWLILAGWALAHRTRRDIAVAAVPAVIAGAWMVTLRILLPGPEPLNGDLGLPFVGLYQAVTDIWLGGHEMIGMASTLGALALGGLALARRGIRHPFGVAIVLHLAFMAVSGVNPLGVNFGGSRTGLALTALALVTLATPGAPAVPPFTRRRRVDEVREPAPLEAVG